MSGSLFDIRRLELSSCLMCHRQLSRVDRRYDQPSREPDHCGFCDVPLTDRARRQQPRIQGRAGC